MSIKNAIPYLGMRNRDDNKYNNKPTWKYYSWFLFPNLGKNCSSVPNQQHFHERIKWCIWHLDCTYRQRMTTVRLITSDCGERLCFHLPDEHASYPVLSWSSSVKDFKILLFPVRILPLCTIWEADNLLGPILFDKSVSWFRRQKCKFGSDLWWPRWTAEETTQFSDTQSVHGSIVLQFDSCLTQNAQKEKTQNKLGQNKGRIIIGWKQSLGNSSLLADTTSVVIMMIQWWGNVRDKDKDKILNKHLIKIFDTQF